MPILLFDEASSVQQQQQQTGFSLTTTADWMIVKSLLFLTTGGAT
jgi:hypothetical protein